MGFSIYQYDHKPSESIKIQLKMNINSKYLNIPKHELGSQSKWEIHNSNYNLNSKLHDHNNHNVIYKSNRKINLKYNHGRNLQLNILIKI